MIRIKWVDAREVFEHRLMQKERQFNISAFIAVAKKFILIHHMLWKTPNELFPVFSTLLKIC